MAEQFVNPEATKLEDETVALESEDQKVEQMAEEAAEKAAKAEQKYDGQHSIFSK